MGFLIPAKNVLKVYEKHLLHSLDFIGNILLNFANLLFFLPLLLGFQ
jgi:hypothetical protein